MLFDCLRRAGGWVLGSFCFAFSFEISLCVRLSEDFDVAALIFDKSVSFLSISELQLKLAFHRTFYEELGVLLVLTTTSFSHHHHHHGAILCSSA